MDIENKDDACERFFVVRTPCELYITAETQEFVNIIYNRYSKEAEIWRLDSLEEANAFVCQIHPQRHYANPVCFGVSPMPIPTSGIYQLINSEMQQRCIALKNPKENELLPNVGGDILANDGARITPMYDENVCWGIDSLNGFATAPNLDALVYYMSSLEAVYPHAVAWPDFNTAYWRAREMYTKRFYRRYDGVAESILLPDVHLNEGDVYVDGLHDDREKHRKDNVVLNKLIAVGIL